jgi:hypothetical protein
VGGAPATAARYADELGTIVTDPDVPAKVKVAAFNALRLADKDQWERDHPAEATLLREMLGTRSAER